MPRRAFMFFFLLASLAGSATLADEAQSYRFSNPQVSGRINDRRIVEASGLARSHRVPGRLWTINDGGSEPRLFALDSSGKVQGSIRLGGATNVDWEDLASFEYAGNAWLLVADTGDNAARRRYSTLYLVEEPAELPHQHTTSAREIRFTYPDGPLDAEAVAVDVPTDSVLILVKRTVPARLYRVPLFSGDAGSVQRAELLGELASLPQPSQEDRDRALANQSWHWQPTAMDFAEHRQTAAILTYRGIYVYPRASDESWFDALQKPPQSVSLGTIGLAEAIAFSNNDNSIYVTVEGRKPVVYRSDRAPFTTGSPGK